MEKLEQACKFVGKLLVLLFVVCIYIGTLFVCAFLTYDCYMALRHAAPAICEISNPVPPGIIIVETTMPPQGFKKEEKDPKLFFGDSKTILVLFEGDEIIFYKSGDIAGEVVFYSLSFNPGGRIFFRSVKKADIEGDRIRVQYKWEIIGGLFAVFIVFAMCFFAVKYEMKSLEKIWNWTFKKPKTEV